MTNNIVPPLDQTPEQVLASAQPNTPPPPPPQSVAQAPALVVADTSHKSLLSRLMTGAIAGLAGGASAPFGSSAGGQLGARASQQVMEQQDQDAQSAANNQNQVNQQNFQNQLRMNQEQREAYETQQNEQLRRAQITTSNLQQLDTSQRIAHLPEEYRQRAEDRANQVYDGTVKAYQNAGQQILGETNDDPASIAAALAGRGLKTSDAIALHDPHTGKVTLVSARNTEQNAVSAQDANPVLKALGLAPLKDGQTMPVSEFNAYAVHKHSEAVQQMQSEAQFAQQKQLERMREGAASALEDKKTANELKVANIKAGAGTDPVASINDVPEAYRAQVQAIGEGRVAPPSARSGAALKLMNMVNSVYPDYDGSQYPTYAATRKAFTSGKEGQAINSFNTALEHLGRAEKNMPDNGSYPVANWLANKASEASGGTRSTAFEADRVAVSAEVAKAYKGGVINKEEHDEYQKLLNPNASKPQLKANFQELKGLLGGKLASYDQQWRQSMPKGAVKSMQIVSPSAQSVLNSGGETKTYQGHTYSKGADGQWHRQ